MPMSGDGRVSWLCLFGILLQIPTDMTSPNIADTTLGMGMGINIFCFFYTQNLMCAIIYQLYFTRIFSDVLHMYSKEALLLYFPFGISNELQYAKLHSGIHLYF